MSVAISVATALFITATFLHARPNPSSPRWGAYAYAPVGLSIPLLASLYTVYLTPSTVGGPGPLGETFLKTVLWMHGLLVLPLVVPAMPLGDVVKVPRAEVRSGRETEAVEAVSPNAVDQGKKAANVMEEKGQEHSISDASTIKPRAARSPAVTANSTDPDRPPLYIPFRYFYLLLLFIILQIHSRATLTLFSHHASLPPSSPLANFSTVQYLLYTYLAHPAQASISSDVVCTLFIALSWLLCTGSYTSIFFKGLLASSIAAGGAIKVLGVNWRLVASLLPILAMAGVGLGMLGLSSVRSRNERKRKGVLEGLGLVENGVEQGAKGRAPRKVGRRMMVGFWHPYW